MPKISAAMLAAWAKASENDPPPDPADMREMATGVSREYPNLQTLVAQTHAHQVNWTRGTRWEKLHWDGTIYTAEPINETATAAMLDSFDDWQRETKYQRGTVWANHVAQARILDGELVVLVKAETRAGARQERKEANR